MEPSADENDARLISLVERDQIQLSVGVQDQGEVREEKQLVEACAERAEGDDVEERERD